MVETKRQLDLNLLPILHALIQTRSVTLAAKRLGVSQPKVSRALNRLRYFFQDPLLIKNNIGMLLTDRAIELTLPVAKWMTATENLLRIPLNTNPVTFMGTFKIATTDYGLLTVVIPIMQTIIENAPSIKLEIFPLSPDNLNELTAGTFDIVVTGYDPPPGRLFEQFLYREDYECVFRNDHPLLYKRDNQPLSLHELTQWPHITLKINDDDGDSFCEQLALLGLSRRILLRIPYFSSAPHILLACDAIMIMPKKAAIQFCKTSALRSLPIPLELKPFNYWVLWHARSRRDPVTRWLIEQMTTHAQANIPLNA